jgi:hypothetical protein
MFRNLSGETGVGSLVVCLSLRHTTTNVHWIKSTHTEHEWIWTRSVSIDDALTRSSRMLLRCCRSRRWLRYVVPNYTSWYKIYRPHSDNPRCLSVARSSALIVWYNQSVIQSICQPIWLSETRCTRILWSGASAIGLALVPHITLSVRRSRREGATSPELPDVISNRWWPCRQALHVARKRALWLMAVDTRQAGRSLPSINSSMAAVRWYTNCCTLCAKIVWIPLSVTGPTLEFASYTERHIQYRYFSVMPRLTRTQRQEMYGHRTKWWVFKMRSFQFV